MRNNFRVLVRAGGGKKSTGSIIGLSVLKMKKSHADQVAHFPKRRGKVGRSYQREIMFCAVLGAGS